MSRFPHLQLFHYISKKPAVYRTQQHGKDGELCWYSFMEGTGHRLSYQREEDWIEIVW